MTQQQPDHLPFYRVRAWWRRVAFASAGSVLGHALLFASNIIAARGLGPDGYGTFILALSIAGFITLFLDLTFEESLVFFGGRELAQGRVGALRQLLRRVVAMDVSLGLVSFAVVVVAAPALSQLMRAQVEPHLIQIAALPFLAATLDSSTGAALLVAGRADLRVVGSVVTGVARLVLFAGALVLGATASNILLAAAAASLLGSMAQYVAARRAGWSSWSRHPRLPVDFRGVFRFATFSSITGALSAGTHYIVPVLLGLFVPATDVAIFSIALMPLAAAGLLTTQARLAVLPEQTQMWHKGAVRELKSSVWRFATWSAAGGVVLGAVGAALVPLVLPAVFGAAYIDGVGAVRLMLLGLPALLATGWLKMVPTAVGRPGSRTAVAAVEFTTTSGMCAAMTYAAGRSGSVIGYVIAAYIVATLWARVARRLLSP